MLKTLETNQEEVWDEIAKVWKGYRNVPVREVARFLKKKKGKVLDLGCGSGRNLIRFKGEYYGVDFSEEMLKYAKEKAQALKMKSFFEKSSIDNLSFESNFFDSAIFIDSLHCLESSASRRKALQELFRVLKPGSEAFISVWDRNQERFKDKGKETFVPWKVNYKTLDRYYYLYDQQELIDLLKELKFEIVKIFEKIKNASNKTYSQKSIKIIVAKPLLS